LMARRLWGWCRGASGIRVSSSATTPGSTTGRRSGRRHARCGGRRRRSRRPGCGG
jgi:hypothetical protein